jgi:hypothetical protein
MMNAAERAAEIERHMNEARKFDRQAALGFPASRGYAIWHRAEARKLRDGGAGRAGNEPINRGHPCGQRQSPPSPARGRKTCPRPF